MRHTRSQRGNTRSHMALVSVTLAKCPDCGTPSMPHMTCKNCGKYKGRQVIDVVGKAAKKEKKAKAKAKEGR